MSSILETFLILFESDSSDVKKGADEAKQSTNKLEEAINKTKGATGKLGESFLATARSAAGALAAIVSIGAITRTVFNAADFADQLNQSSKALGISVENLSMWGDAAKMAGGSAEGFQGDVAALNANMSQMDVIGKSRVQPFFKEIGINMLDASGKARPALDLFKDIAGAFDKMSKQESIGFGRKLGLSMGTIMLLQQGRRGLDELLERQKALGVVTTHQAEVAAKWHDAMKDTSHIMRTLGLAVAELVLPALTRLLKVSEDVMIWFQENESQVAAVKDVMIALAAAVVGAYLPAMISAAVATIAATWPFLLLAAAIGLVIGAFYLVMEDLESFDRGAASVTGNIVNYFKNMASDVIWAWQQIKDFVLGVIDAIMHPWDAFAAKVTTFQADVGDMLFKGKAQVDAASSSPIGAQTSGSIGAAPVNKSVSIGEVNIKTDATDAEGISKSIGTHLNDQMNRTINANDDGIKA